MARSKPNYTQAEQDLIEDLRSRMNVSRGIIKRRAEMGLTQAELGRRAKTKQSRVSEVESMKGNPRFSTLDNVTRVLGLMLTVEPRTAVLRVTPFQEFGVFYVDYMGAAAVSLATLAAPSNWSEPVGRVTVLASGVPDGHD